MNITQKNLRIGATVLPFILANKTNYAAFSTELKDIVRKGGLKMHKWVNFSKFSNAGEGHSIPSHTWPYVGDNNKTLPPLPPNRLTDANEGVINCIIYYDVIHHSLTLLFH